VTPQGLFKLDVTTTAAVRPGCSVPVVRRKKRSAACISTDNKTVRFSSPKRTVGKLAQRQNALSARVYKYTMCKKQYSNRTRLSSLSFRFSDTGANIIIGTTTTSHDGRPRIFGARPSSMIFFRHDAITTRRLTVRRDFRFRFKR